MTDEPLSHRLAREICSIYAERECSGPDCICWDGNLRCGTAMAEEVARHSASQVQAARLEAADVADDFAFRRQSARQVAIELRRLAGK